MHHSLAIHVKHGRSIFIHQGQQIEDGYSLLPLDRLANRLAVHDSNLYSTRFSGLVYLFFDLFPAVGLVCNRDLCIRKSIASCFKRKDEIKTQSWPPSQLYSSIRGNNRIRPKISGSKARILSADRIGII